MGTVGARGTVRSQEEPATDAGSGGRTEIRKEGPRALLHHFTSLRQGGIWRWAVDLLSARGLWIAPLGRAGWVHNRLEAWAAHRRRDQAQAQHSSVVGLARSLRACSLESPRPTVADCLVRSGKLLRAYGQVARGTQNGPVSDGPEGGRNWRSSLAGLSRCGNNGSPAARVGGGRRSSSHLLISDR